MCKEQFSGKKILFLAPNFYSLTNDIIGQLNKFDAIVTYIDDKVQKYNPFFSTSSLYFLKKIYFRLFSPNKRYHAKHIKQIDNYYDFFFCIDGYSFDQEIITILKRNNPHIKSILYLWDSTKFYNFTSLFIYFDKIFSFDYLDSKKHHISYLPLYWVPTENSYSFHKDIDISFVGTLHTDRYRILTKISTYCRDNNLSACLKLVVNKQKCTFVDTLRYYYYRNKKTPNALGFVDEYLYLRGRLNSSIITSTKVSSDELNEIYNRSKCVIDIELPYQSGLTNRTINALANGCKIITTNENIRNSPLWEGDNIMCIDRVHVQLRDDFIKKPYSRMGLNSYLFSLRIDNWLNTVFYGK